VAIHFGDMSSCAVVSGERTYVHALLTVHTHLPIQSPGTILLFLTVRHPRTIPSVHLGFYSIATPPPSLPPPPPHHPPKRLGSIQSLIHQPSTLLSHPHLLYTADEVGGHLVSSPHISICYGFVPPAPVPQPVHFLSPPKFAPYPLL
jgi:hypothetical protein